MRHLTGKWVRAFVLGLAVGGASMLGISRLTATNAKSWEEWTMPARFEGQGAVTLGCAFWNVPEMTGYSDDNPRTDFVNIAVGGAAGDLEAFAVVDGPNGTAFVSGTKCAVSVDWSRFPAHARPAE